jgi:thiol-disulfide isomerase/thioredoxin
MKRMMILALGLMLALALATGALAEPVAVEDMVGQEMEDFSIETLSGKNYTLYEALETHDLMVINFWASWCGPCQYEFPFLEEAWEKYSDRIGVVAISVEENDTGAILDNFVKEYGLKFTVMSDSDKLNQKFGIYGVPTTIIVNKDKKIVAVEVGAKTSTEEFTNLFDKLLGETGKTENTDAEDSAAEGNVTEESAPEADATEDGAEVGIESEAGDA